MSIFSVKCETITTKNQIKKILTWSGLPFHCLRCLMEDGQPSQYSCYLDHLQQQTHHPAQAKTKHLKC